MASENRNEDLLKKAGSDIGFLHDLIDSIEITYTSFDQANFNVEKLAASVKAFKQVGYRIIAFIPSHNRLLIYCECHYEDLDTNWKGDISNMKKSVLAFFAVKFDIGTNRVSIHGPMFNDNAEKFAFEKFAEHIKNAIQL